MDVDQHLSLSASLALSLSLNLSVLSVLLFIYFLISFPQANAPEAGCKDIAANRVMAANAVEEEAQATAKHIPTQVVNLSTIPRMMPVLAFTHPHAYTLTVTLTLTLTLTPLPLSLTQTPTLHGDTLHLHGNILLGGEDGFRATARKTLPGGSRPLHL